MTCSFSETQSQHACLNQIPFLFSFAFALMVSQAFFAASIRFGSFGFFPSAFLTCFFPFFFVVFVIRLTSFQISKFQQIGIISLKTFLYISGSFYSLTRDILTVSMRSELFEDDKKAQRDRDRISVREINGDCPDLTFLVG